MLVGGSSTVGGAADDAELRVAARWLGREYGTPEKDGHVWALSYVRSHMHVLEVRRPW